jgi:S-methyl-5-thioribose-1-phosphate isomerase
MDVIETVRWSHDGAGVRILDQRELPLHEVYRDLRSVEEIYDAILTLAVRGAPAIGIAGAMGVALSASGVDGNDRMQCVSAAAARIRSARPTAVNLGWAVDRVLAAASGPDISASMIAEATQILEEDRAMCQAIGRHGATLIPDGARVLTHCNAGALATGGIGTALAGIYVAAGSGKRVHVFADETRPLLQGSRLTAWELQRAGIPVTVLVDGAAASLMARDQVDLCIVGADRIAANGDVANKIGTYPLAIAAKRHGIPFYVAAPSSTFDPSTAAGAEIVIEQRSGDEVRRASGGATAPAAVDVYNPAFDVTPSELITAIVSDRGVHRPPYDFTFTASDA